MRLPDPAAVPALLDTLAGTGNASVSTFELLSSGAVASLRGYLQGADLGDGPDRANRLLQRLGDFAGGCDGCGGGVKKGGGGVCVCVCVCVVRG